MKPTEAVIVAPLQQEELKVDTRNSAWGVCERHAPSHWSLRTKRNRQPWLRDILQNTPRDHQNYRSITDKEARTAVGGA